ncbi:hypothetical protein GRX03_15520 [Halovenus sp. WSH3]|uniref:Halobacterial output domain-containing protein n=1 Tax=Halovenus carboxidivorans TaxID=2692199 RepID=A0A6B0T3Z7_9EURY|nr:HalOD1 output domain-containing protein [Halovenus carboxidivorans]MXR53008.1 hypothetical protein [Halovenus carboxidivorans]
MREHENEAEQTALHGPGQETVRTDWKRYEQPVLAIVEAIAAVEGKRPTDLPPLGEEIDVDALTALLETNQADETITVSFRYQGLDVTLDGRGQLTVTAVSD